MRASMRTSASATSGIRYGGGVGRGFSYRGTYREAVRLASGRYALIKNAQEFTLAPWPPVIKCSLGREAVGRVTNGGISW